MDYRGLGFLATVLFGPFSLPPIYSPVNKLMKKIFIKSVSELNFTTNSGLGEPTSLSQFFCVSPVELTEGKGAHRNASLL